MFIDIFERLCESRGVSPSRVLDDIGMYRSTHTNWRNGGEPSNPTKKKIADYFGITVAQLMSGEIEKAPAEEAEADGEMIKLLEEFRSNPELKTLFSLGKSATPKELKKYINVIKAMRGRDEDE